MTQLQLNPYAPLQPGKVACVLLLVAPAKQQASVAQQTLAHTPGQCAALCDALKVAQQVRPADLALRQGQVVVARIPVAHRDEAGLLAQNQLGRHLPTRRVDTKPHPPIAEQRPHPQGVLVVLVAGLIGVAHGSL